MIPRRLAMGRFIVLPCKREEPKAQFLANIFRIK